MIPRRALAPVLALALLGPAACSGDDGPGAGEARLEVDGRASVERADGSVDRVDDHADLSRGDRVTLEQGVGVLELADDVRMEVREGFEGADDSVLLMGTVPVLEAGDLLVMAPKDAEVEAAGTLVQVSGGAARLRRALGMGVAAYDSTVALDSAGEEREIPALREMIVPALGRPPTAPRPLRYADKDEDPTAVLDPWDRRFLGDAIDLGRELEGLAKRLTGNLVPGEGRSPEFFRIVLPGLAEEAEFVAELLQPERTPGETLVGAAIADLGERETFAVRWDEVFEFRDLGAEWGLVAKDQAVTDAPLTRAIDEASGNSPLQFTSGGLSDPGTTPTTPPGDPAGGGPGTSAPPGTAPPGTVPPPTTPTTPPPTVPPLDVGPVIEDTTDPVVDLVTDLLDGILGGLLGSPTP